MDHNQNLSLIERKLRAKPNTPKRYKNNIFGWPGSSQNSIATSQSKISIADSHFDTVDI